MDPGWPEHPPIGKEDLRLGSCCRPEALEETPAVVLGHERVYREGDEFPGQKLRAGERTRRARPNGSDGVEEREGKGVPLARPETSASLREPKPDLRA